MQVKDILEVNLRKLNPHPIFRRRLLPMNDDQVRLTEKWILPNADLLLEDIRLIRAEIDQEFRLDDGITKRMIVFEKEYPYGLCKPIRDALIERMIARMDDAPGPGLTMLRNFILEGGIVQPFWGIDKGKYFQNAIQIGNAIVDVANDTVDSGKEPVVLYPTLAEAPIKRIESFTEFAQIAESYWHHDIYPNIYLPHLAPLFPIISIQPIYKASGLIARGLMLQTEAGDLQFKNLYTHHNGHLFGPAAHFLFESDYSKKRLPEELVRDLTKSEKLKQFQHESPNGYRISANPDEARKEFTRFHLANSRIPVSHELLQESSRVQALGLRLDRVILVEEEA